MVIKRRGPAQEAFRRISKGLAKQKEWKINEKLALLEALKKYGSRYIELLMPSVPHRTKTEVRYYLIKQRRLGQYYFCDPPTKRKNKYQHKPKNKFPPKQPFIMQWRDIIFEKMCASKLFTGNTINFTHLRRTLLILAAYEKHPTVEGIDFSELYHTLYYYVNGEPAPWFTSKRTQQILWLTYQWFCKLLTQTDISEELNFFSEVDIAPKERYPCDKTYLKKPPTVVGTKTCNALCVPECLLTPHLDNVIEYFVKTFITEEHALNWFCFWYSKDDKANKTMWEAASNEVLKHVYQVKPQQLDFPYKIKVVFTSEQAKEMEDQYMGWKLITFPSTTAQAE